MRRNVAAVALLTLIIALCMLTQAPAAWAGVKKILPENFRPSRNYNNDYNQSPSTIAGGGSTAGRLWAPVKLPVGVTVTGLQYKHTGGYGTAHTDINLYRVSLEEGVEKMAYASSDAAGGQTVVVETYAVNYAKVRRIYRYYVEVNAQNNISQIGWVKILYDE